MGSEVVDRWYLPRLLRRWRDRSGDEAVDGLTRLVAANHPDAVIEIEEVDLSFLLSCLEGEEVEAAVETGAEAGAETGAEAAVEVESSDLIDKFLSLEDFRIVPTGDESSEEESEAVELDWELVDVESPFDAKEELASEELAEIFMKQGLYDEAKEIYSKLSLQYSEKSIYFAELTQRLSEKSSKPKGGGDKN